MNKIKNLFPAGNAKFNDRGVTRASELIQEWHGENVNGVGLVGLPLSKTSISHSGSVFAPETIRKALSSYTTYAIEDDYDLRGNKLWDFGDVQMHVTDLLQSHQRIEESLQQLFHTQPSLIPIILGGDHSISCPSIKAFAKTKGTIGVIQFDAHHDLREIKNEDGGPSNGTPFRGLLESGAIRGENLIQIGIRNFSNGKIYSDYAKENGVSVYTMSEVRDTIITEIIQESLTKLETRVDSIYVSVDMDVLDQAHAPGCPAIGPGGMDSTTLLQGINALSKHPMVGAIDIVEIDPTLDFRDMTSRVAAHVILHFMKGIMAR